MSCVVVTAGKKYLDIDAYASSIAYARLLNFTGTRAKAVTTAEINQSVPPVLRELDANFDDYDVAKDDVFAVLDVSDPESLDEMVDLDRVVEVIDHHLGFEEYWRSKPTVKVDIEFIGSVGTMIYERFADAGKTDLLTEDLCRLLSAAILDNTLGFGAAITTDRDRIAYDNLVKLGNLPDDWEEQYFTACEKEILQDLKDAIRNDTKVLSVEGLPKVVGQLAVYDGMEVVKRMNDVRDVYKGDEDWALNVISLRDGKSYLIANVDGAKRKLERLFGGKFDDNVMVLDKMMLRKEIVKRAMGAQSD